MSYKQMIGKALRPSESTFVILGLFLVIGGITIVTMYRNSTGVFNAEIDYENLSPVQKEKIKRLEQSVFIGEDEKNVRYAERIKEASSIGLGFSIFVLEQRISNDRTMDLKTAIREFSTNELLPPGVNVLFPEQDLDYAILQTNRGYYFIRYRAKPLLIEILGSSSKGFADGSVFILRLPDTSAANLELDKKNPNIKTAGAWASLYEAPENIKATIPKPFVDSKVYRAMNWKVRPLQQRELSPEKITELYEYLEKEIK